MFMKILFSYIAFFEGVSNVLLLCFGMPLKYIFGNPVIVELTGMPHGILFILYVIMSFLIRKQMNWNNRDFIVVLLASILPFGTFYIDKYYIN